MHLYPGDLQAFRTAATSPSQCGHHGNNPPPSGGVAVRHQKSRKPGALHDSRIPPCEPHQGLLEPKSSTPGGYNRVAASRRQLCRGCGIPWNKRCEGHRKSQDPPNRHLATPPRYGGGGRSDSLPDSGGHLT